MRRSHRRKLSYIPCPSVQTTLPSLVLAVARGIVTDSDALRAREALDRELEEIERDSAALSDALTAGRLQQQRLVDAQGLLGVLRSKLDERFNSQKRAEIARCLVRLS